jgi:hypothetical protein
MVPITTVPHLKPLMYFIPARWGFEGAIAPERVALATNHAWLIDLGRSDTSVPDFVEAGKFKCAVAQMASDSYQGAWGFTTYDQPYIPFLVLSGMTFVMLIALCIFLKRRDPV